MYKLKGLTKVNNVFQSSGTTQITHQTLNYSWINIIEGGGIYNMINSKNKMKTKFVGVCVFEHTKSSKMNQNKNIKAHGDNFLCS